MAVYKRTYRPYVGSLTPERSRFLVLTRYSLNDLFNSRAFAYLLVFSFVPVLFWTAFIYVTNSPGAQALLRIGGRPVFAIDAAFFSKVIMGQSWIAMLLSCWVGPQLVAGDLANGALPLFLSRPLSRAEYVLGKAGVLVVLLSAVTWIPTLLMFGLQAELSKTPWGLANAGIAFGSLAAFLIWIAVLTLVALAISALVKWRIIATAATFALFVLPSGFGEAINAVMRTYWGRLLNVVYLFHVIASNLIGAEITY